MPKCADSMLLSIVASNALGFTFENQLLIVSIAYGIYRLRLSSQCNLIWKNEESIMRRHEYLELNLANIMQTIKSTKIIRVGKLNAELSLKILLAFKLLFEIRLDITMIVMLRRRKMAIYLSMSKKKYIAVLENFTNY